MDKNKKIILAAGIAMGVAVGVWTFFTYFKNNEAKTGFDLEAIRKDVKKMGSIRLNSMGLINFDHFMAIVKLISKHAKK